MKIIISPALTMKIETDIFPVLGQAMYLEDTKKLMDAIRGLTYEEAKRLWTCNDKLATLNYKRFANMDLDRAVTPAILSYVGMQYQHMSPNVFTEEALTYIKAHVRIISGFYGVLAPFDGVVPYRLELGAKFSFSDYKDLFEFWGDKLYRGVLDEDRTIVNLTSKEYARAVEKYVTSKDRFVTIEFGQLIDGQVKQKATIAKMARGEMVRYMAENQVENLEQIHDFNFMNFTFCKERSNEKHYVFLH